MSQQRLLIAIFAFAISLTSFAAQAQVNQPEQVHVALKNVKELLADLNYITLLDTKNGKLQWPKLEDVLAVFLDGIHQEHPLRMDVLLDQKGQVMRFALPIDATGPVKVNNAFVVNIAGWIGAAAKAQGNLIQCKAGSEAIWIEQFISNKMLYGLVSDDRTVLAGLKPNPIATIQPVLDAGYDVAGFVTNQAEGAIARREAIQALRRQVVALLKPLEGESDDDFEVRTLATGHQLDELERIYSDVENLTLGWTTDVPQKQARLDLEMTALPKTELEASLLELAAKPSHFGAIQKAGNSILFGRVNHALDQMRQKNITQLANQMQAAAIKKVAGNKDYSDETKAALTKAIGDFIGTVNNGVKLGVIDAFADVTLQDGKRSALGGIKVADGHALIPVLESLKAAGWKVEVNVKVDEEGVRWHSLEFPSDKELFHAMGTASFTVVTTADAVLYASGPDADKKLTDAWAAIKTPPVVDGVVAELWTQLNPWIDYINDRHARNDVGIDVTALTDKEKQDRKESLERRTRATTAFSEGGDTIHMKIVRKDNKVSGTTVFDTGILRFVGMMMSQFAEKSL